MTELGKLLAKSEETSVSRMQLFTPCTESVSETVTCVPCPAVILNDDISEFPRFDAEVDMPSPHSVL